MRPITGVFNRRDQADWLLDLSREVDKLRQKSDAVKNDVVVVVERQDRGKHAGVNTPKQWERRQLNEIKSDLGGIASIHNGRVRLEPGVYQFMVSVPAVQVNSHQARVVVGGVAFTGTSESADEDVATGSRSVVTGRFVLAQKSAVAVEHWTEKEKAKYGLGKAGDFEEEIYTVAEFRRIGDK